MNNTVGELTRMLNYLDCHIDSELVKAAVQSSHFKRKHSLQFQHFTVEQIDFLNQVIEKMEEALSDAGKTRILSVQHYLCDNNHTI